MPTITTEPYDALFEAMSSKITGDTGTGGLFDTSADGAARIQSFVDSMSRERQENPPLPMIEYRARMPRFSRLGTVRHDARVTITGYFERGRDADDKRKKVGARLLTLLDGASDLSASGWSFSSVSVLDSRQGPVRGDELQWIWLFDVTLCLS